MSVIRGVLHSHVPTARSLSKLATKLSRTPSLPTTIQSRPISITTIPNFRHGSIKSQETSQTSNQSSNPALSFPCLDKVELRSASLSEQSRAAVERSKVTDSGQSGPEPSYTTGAHQTFRASEPLLLDWGGVLPSFDIAFETWGSLNSNKNNAILLHTGLSASSHAHSTPENPQPGWWEKFIGPGGPLDTNKYFVICTNVIGGCYGSTGPSSLDPANQERYVTRFPILTMEDMVRAQFKLLDNLGIEKLYASVGSSMGGMQSLAAAVLFPERVARVVSISGCARSHPYSIAMRHTQRQVLMNDPHWNRGFYYSGIPPHAGMKLARQIATITYRSGPEWEKRFGRRRADPSKPPALCPDFLIETYLDHAGEKWCLQYDANSLLYVSKAMDLFDLGAKHRNTIQKLRAENAHKLHEQNASSSIAELCSLTLPDTPYEEVSIHGETEESISDPNAPSPDLIDGMRPMAGVPTLVLGVASDILFPAWQQREIAETLRQAGNDQVTHCELGEDKSLFGHDTFLLDLEGVGGTVGRWLG
jgi:homoserine O-acetyltransferase